MQTTAAAGTTNGGAGFAFRKDGEPHGQYGSGPAGLSRVMVPLTASTRSARSMRMSTAEAAACLAALVKASAAT